MTANVLDAVFVKEPAWHNLGHLVPEPILVSEGVENYNLDHRFHLGNLVLKTQIDGRRYEWDISGEFKGLVRGPIYGTEHEGLDQPQLMRIVSDNYGIVNNIDIARALDPLTEHYPLTSLGALNVGKKLGGRFFVCLDMGDRHFSVGSRTPEHYRTFLFVAEDRVTGSLHWHVTPVRVVCANTWAMGTDRARSSQRFVHTKDILEQLNIRAQFEKDIVNEADDAYDQFVSMVNRDLTDNEFNQLVAQIYKMPTEKAVVKQAIQLRKTAQEELQIDLPTIENLAAGIGVPVLTGEEADRLDLVRLAANKAVGSREQVEKDTAKVEAARSEVADLYVAFNDEHPDYAATGYALANAVIEREDFVRVPGHWTAAQGVIYGDRSKVKDLARRVALTGKTE